MARKELSKDEAIALTRGPYADVLEKTLGRSIAPFLWREWNEEGIERIRNGTVFFVSADRPFAVTADHVLDQHLKARAQFGYDARCQLGDLQIDIEDRLIARNRILDIATFAITPHEVERSAPGEGKFAMSFEPTPPQIERGVLFAGFPARERRFLSASEIESGIYTALTVAHNVSDRQISVVSFGSDRWRSQVGQPHLSAMTLPASAEVRS